jgi:hypothetical protein
MRRSIGTRMSSSRAQAPLSSMRVTCCVFGRRRSSDGVRPVRRLASFSSTSLKPGSLRHRTSRRIWARGRCGTPPASRRLYGTQAAPVLASVCAARLPGRQIEQGQNEHCKGGGNAVGERAVPARPEPRRRRGDRESGDDQRPKRERCSIRLVRRHHPLADWPAPLHRASHHSPILPAHQRGGQRGRPHGDRCDGGPATRRARSTSRRATLDRRPPGWPYLRDDGPCCRVDPADVDCEH